jgi:hypothetical protein
LSETRLLIPGDNGQRNTNPRETKTYKEVCHAAIPYPRTFLSNFLLPFIQIYQAGIKHKQSSRCIMPSVVAANMNVPIPLKISDDGMTVAYDDPTAWNVTAAPAVVGLFVIHPLYLYTKPM